jgi:hypothetical protein
VVPEQPDIVVESHSITRVVVDEQTEEQRSSRGWPWIGVAAIAVAAAFAASWYRSSRKAPKLTEKDTVVIADVAVTANNGGE